MEESVQAAGRVLVMVAVEAEREALAGLAGADGRFDVRLCGVGPVAAAARTAAALAAAGPGAYALVLSAGIGGGFADRALPGSLVVATEAAAPELGAETPGEASAGGGFLPLEELGFGASRYPAEPTLAARLAAALTAAGLAVTAGPVLTVSTVTGTAETAKKRGRRTPAPAAEGMEGFGVAEAAGLFGLPFLELRAISNAVGPRDRGAWKMKEAFAALRAAVPVIREVLIRG
ncbi:futalosine hydrolase [Gorillibacterium sp. sgz500922]|uniref:futalosine hydrolase n=1 Tax=Gorillibacterium sp. sgz500922 TaxID=3446694 RepID=UPI003F665C10